MHGDRTGEQGAVIDPPRARRVALAGIHVTTSKGRGASAHDCASLAREPAHRDALVAVLHARDELTRDPSYANDGDRPR